MQTSVFPAALLIASVLFVGGCVGGMGDEGVVVSSTASPTYTQEKFAKPVPKRETYVFMQGIYFPGATVDHSLDGMSFRSLVEDLAPELAKQHYWPAKNLEESDLLIVVHWGVTSPKATNDELRGHTTTEFDRSMGNGAAGGRFQSERAVTENPNADPQAGSTPTDQSLINELFSGHNNDEVRNLEMQQLDRGLATLGGDVANDAVRLLGYGRHLRKLAEKPFLTTTEQSLRLDLGMERYFVVLRAYDLKNQKDGKPPVVWTMHLNMRSPGQNFKMAMDRMGTVAVDFFGRGTDSAETVLPKIREGTVTVGEVTIVGEK